MRPSQKNILVRRWRGFTLVEMLIVISVIVVIIAMTVPIFKAMSGDRSVDSAQNMVSAMLQRARARAIGLQSPRAVFFYEDQATKKTAMVLVRINDPSGTVNPANVIELDEEADEYQMLPTGVGAAFALGNTLTGVASATSTYEPYGLIVFDESGRIMTVPSYTTFATGDNSYAPPPPPQTGPPDTRLRFRYAPYIGPTIMDTLGTPPNPQQSSSAVVMLYDKVPFAAADPAATPGPSTAFTAVQSQWLDANALALAVNRYNGTILKSQ
jgi:prepilin-type N-terminal cleavage/methylation domain-containing protein